MRVAVRRLDTKETLSNVSSYVFTLKFPPGIARSISSSMEAQASVAVPVDTRVVKIFSVRRHTNHTSRASLVLCRWRAKSANNPIAVKVEIDMARERHGEIAFYQLNAKTPAKGRIYLWTPVLAP